ncbi:MAG: amidohydrolase family protein, partial [Anaerolineae bacterium]
IEYATEGAPPGDYRHRVEHCGLALPGIPERLKRMGVIPVPQPVFLYFDGDVYMDRVGAERSRWLYPVKTLLDNGLPASGSSDAPVVPDINPLLGMYTAVTRRSRVGRIVAPEEAISVEDALSLYTSRAAYACGEEHFKGSLSVGKAADLVVLGDDPLRVSPDDLPNLPVEMVVLDGRVQFP